MRSDLLTAGVQVRIPARSQFVIDRRPRYWVLDNKGPHLTHFILASDEAESRMGEGRKRSWRQFWSGGQVPARTDRDQDKIDFLPDNQPDFEFGTRQAATISLTLGRGPATSIQLLLRPGIAVAIQVDGEG